MIERFYEAVFLRGALFSGPVFIHSSNVGEFCLKLRQAMAAQFCLLLLPARAGRGLPGNESILPKRHGLSIVSEGCFPPIQMSD